MDKLGFTFTAGVFVAIVLSLSSLGMPLISSPNSVDTINPDSSICDNIGGFDAVGDVLSCVSEKLGILDYLNITSQNEFIRTLFIPIGLTLAVMIILILRGN